MLAELKWYFNQCRRYLVGRDGWAPYRQFTTAFHQTCVGHLLRRCRTLRQDHPRARFPARIARILQHALDVRDRRAAGTISTHGVDVARGHLFNTILRTAHQRGLDPTNVITTLLRAPKPIVSPHFYPTAASGS